MQKAPEKGIVRHDAVREWRLEQLEQAGYGPYEAMLLCRYEDVDLHVAVDLLRHGCPIETALRILL